MSRLIIVSNRVAPISEGGPAASVLAVGLYDALKETGGMWFGWSGDVLDTPPDSIKLEEHGPVTFATIGLIKRDYDQYHRSFSNATLWPAFHYRPDLIEFDRNEYDGHCRVKRWVTAQLAPLLKLDDVIWVHDYHLIPFAQALRALGVKNRIGFFLHFRFRRRRFCLPCRATANSSKQYARSICSAFKPSRICAHFAITSSRRGAGRSNSVR